MFCSQCGAELKGEEKFCGRCGAKVASANAQTTTAAQTTAATQTVPTYTPHDRGTLLRESKSNTYSYFAGDPQKKVFKKSTGTVRIYDNRVEYEKVVIISKAFWVGGLIGGALAAKKQAYEEKVEKYYYKDISSVKIGKYPGGYPTLVITMNSGETFTLCCGKRKSEEPMEFLGLINQYMG